MKKKVLIADDSRVIHDLYASCLEDQFELSHAYDGAEALCIAVDQRPDLVLLDVMMPMLDGRAVCKQLKKYPATKDIKVLIVSARDTQSDRLVGFEVGADDYIDKPCAPEFLMQRVRKHLQ